MLRKCLYLTVPLLTLLFTGCPVALDSPGYLISIYQTKGDPGIVYLDSALQLYTAPLGIDESVRWSIIDSCGSDDLCATINQVGSISGVAVCESITVLAESENGNSDTYAIKVEQPPKEVDKPKEKG